MMKCDMIMLLMMMKFDVVVNDDDDMCRDVDKRVVLVVKVKEKDDLEKKE